MNRTQFALQRLNTLTIKVLTNEFNGCSVNDILEILKKDVIPLEALKNEAQILEIFVLVIDKIETIEHLIHEPLKSLGYISRWWIIPKPGCVLCGSLSLWLTCGVAVRNPCDIGSNFLPVPSTELCN